MMTKLHRPKDTIKQGVYLLCGMILIALNYWSWGQQSGQGNDTSRIKHLAKLATPAERQAYLKHWMLPYIFANNQQAKKLRDTIISAQNKFKHHHVLSHADFSLVNGYYKAMNTFDAEQPQQWQQLLAKIDTIPPRLLVAIAIYKTHNGKDALFHHSLNLFGTLCFNGHCGIIMHFPATYFPFRIIQYTQYYRLSDAINFFMQSLNSDPLYMHFRQCRATLRRTHQPLIAEKLIPCLPKRLFNARDRQALYRILITLPIKRRIK